eukprot:gene4254-20448_t
MLVDLQNVLCVPDLTYNLLSVHSMTIHGASLTFTEKTCKIVAEGKVVVVAAEDLVSIDYCGANYQDDEDDETEDNSDQSSDAPVSRDVSEQTDNLVQEEDTAQQEGERYVLLAIYVDHILIASNNTSMLQKEKVQLIKKFDIVDQGEAHILGI